MSKIFQNYKKIWEIMWNVQNIHLCQNPSRTMKKIEKSSKIRQKSSKIFENVENYAKCIIYPKNLKFVLKHIDTIDIRWKSQKLLKKGLFYWPNVNPRLLWYRRQISKKQNFFNFCFSQARWRKNWKNFVFWMSGLVFT